VDQSISQTPTGKPKAARWIVHLTLDASVPLRTRHATVGRPGPREDTNRATACVGARMPSARPRRVRRLLPFRKQMPGGSPDPDALLRKTPGRSGGTPTELVARPNQSPGVLRLSRVNNAASGGRAGEQAGTESNGLASKRVRQRRRNLPPELGGVAWCERRRRSVGQAGGRVTLRAGRRAGGSA